MQEALFGSWTQRPHFAGLAPLHDLNHRFLELLAARGADWPSRDGMRWSPEVGARVSRLTTAQRAAVAGCPYALFDLRFEDHDYWRARLTGKGELWVADEGARECATGDFVRLALFYSWHVASSAQLAAQLLLGMTEQTAAAFRQVTLNGLPALAASEAANLTARWAQSEVYWRALLQAASRKDAAHLRRIQLFGLQLAAAARLPTSPALAPRVIAEPPAPG